MEGILAMSFVETFRPRWLSVFLSLFPGYVLGWIGPILAFAQGFICAPIQLPSATGTSPADLAQGFVNSVGACAYLEIMRTAQIP
jgi:hypothetical protein